MVDPPGQMTLPEAAGVLHLPVEGLQALVGAGYLLPSAELFDGPRFAMGDLKAFLARNAADMKGEPQPDIFVSLDDLDPQALLDALDLRSEDMARRALDLLVAVFPEAARWSLAQQSRFIGEARARFEAILAVAALGAAADDSLFDELAAVGAETALSGAPLTEVLMVLRISRDLVVQTAVEVAEERGRHWGLALALVLTRVLPALDRLTDAIARGYWVAVVRRREEEQARYANVVEQASDGVYEVTPEGGISYANPALGVILGRPLKDLVGRPLRDVLGLPGDHQLGAARVEAAVRRDDGVVRLLEIHTVERRVDGVLAGYDGHVRDLTAAVQAEQLRNDFLALLGAELRQPLSTVLGLGATLAEHGDELGEQRVRAVGARIRQQAEQMSRLADDLHEMSRLELGSLVLSPRAVALAPVVGHALDALAPSLDTSAVVVAVGEDVRVIADPRRLEQVVVNLVENAQRFGAPPVEVRARASDSGSSTGVDLEVIDHGEGVEPSLVPTLFSELRSLTGRPRRSPAEGGLGLALVRGLVEAMGGRVRYEAVDGGGAAFVVSLPSA